MQKIVKKNERLSESKAHAGGAAFGAPMGSKKVKKFGFESDIEIVKEIMGNNFHY